MKSKIQYGNLVAEFEGDVNEIETAMDHFLETVKSKGIKVEGPKRKREFVSSLTSRIEELINEGFFNEPKILFEVVNKLAELGYHYPKTTLSPTLLQLVRQKTLRRLGEKGSYKYVKP